ncbi:MAG: cellulase family glycosylhydrolase [Chloroflexi bacterium]|nr:cellulase family glycosylhydrolase [Chloroflexota bacterium]
MQIPQSVLRRTHVLVAATVLVALIAAGCSSTTPAAPKATLPNWAKMGSPDYGVHVFLWGNAPTTERDLKLVKDAGFNWVKQRFEWRYIEGNARGKYDWGEPDRIVEAISKAGLKTIARIDNQPKWARSDKVFPQDGPPDNIEDFANFISALVGRYKGRIQAYEIWNEPNLAREWGNKQPNAAEYVNMLKAAYKAAKRADPDALIISAGLSPTTASGAIATPDAEYLQQMYAAGAKDYFDLLGIHAAGYKAPPEMSPDEIAQDPKYNHGEPGAGRIYGFRHAEDLRDIMVKNGDADKQVAVLEFGWTSDDRPDSPYAWHAVSEQEKADYLVRAFKFAKERWYPWMGVMSAIYVPEPRWTKNDEQYYWSITNPDGSTRPAYEALKSLMKVK